jgi:D-alanine transaminase
MAEELPAVVLPWANWNGEQMPLADVRVSVLDRGFLFGDAIYEVLRIYEGRPFLEPRHFDRLRRSLDKVAIHCDVDRLQQRMHETLARANVDDGMVYMQVTRGEAPRAHRFPDPPVRPNELIAVSAFADPPYAAVRATGAAVITVPDMRWKRCDIKSTNLLANCMAAQQAHEAGATEAIMVAPDGTLNEGSHTSLFGVRDGGILTAPLGQNILPGITRGLLTELAAQADIPLQDEPLHLDMLGSVDELFLTGTTSAVLPVTVIDGRPVGDGTPGPVTRRLVAAYETFVRDWLSCGG